ncbi:HYR domain-containing protein, partial [Capnocytophaga canimorsus]|uniref:HYR domain-containing protein n=1 Tax=Capnocytophaga canimorsus TaxID=28188 RepID=UPI0037D2F19C
MKKFFIAICVFFVTFAVKAQCDLSDFTLNQVPGTCYGNAELTVSNPSCTSSTEILAELISPGNPSPKIEPLTGGSYTFSSLRAGTYTVTLSNQNTGVRGVSKSIEITTSYQNIVWQLNSIAAPTCSDGVNGRIQLKIISGGIGSFKIEVFDKLGNLVVSQNNIPKPTTGNTANIEFLGSDSNPLKSGDYSLQITDLAGGNLGCGAIIKLPIVIPPSTNSNTLCKLIERGELSYIQLGLDAAGDCKHRLKIQIKHPGTNVQLSTEAQNFYKQAGTAQVWNLTTNEGPIDISSTLEDALYIYRNHYTTPFMFKEGDKVRVLIKGAQNTIDETFILKDLDPNKPPFQERRLGWLGNDAQGAVRGWQITYVDKENTCREAYAFRLGQGVSHRIYKDDNDNSKEYKYRYHPWGMYEFDLDYANRATTGKTTPDPDKHWYKVEKLEAGAWTDVSHLVKWSRGKHSMPLTFDDFIADFTDAGAPTATNRTIRYRFTYQDTKIINSGPKGCFPSSPPVMEIDAYYKNNISNYLEGIMTNDWAIRYGYGAYEGTSAMYLATGQYTYVYPIKIKLEMLSRADGKALDAPFPMRLPFMNPEDVQMKVFDPVVEFEGITPEHNFFGYGDFPAGQYRLTITDACGNSHSIIKDFDKYLKYDDKITIDQGCGNGSVTFDVGAKDHRTGEVISQISESIRVGITKKNHLDSWNYFQYATRPVYTTPNGVFSNLPPGDYKILLRGLYHAIHYTNTNNRFASNGFTSAVVPPGVYVWVSMESRIHHQSSYSKIISIQPAVSQLQAEVESTFCDPNTNTGIVNATITSPQDIIRYPLTFELRKKADASLVASHTYDGTNAETSHTFTNVDEGVYVVIIKHECGSNEFETEVKLSNFRQPSIFLNRTNDCPGTPVTLRLSASETLFDIEWYRLEGANRIILGNGNTITQSPTTTTTYYAEYALKPGIGCASTAPATAQRIVRVKDDNTPPTILNCPSDIEVFAEIGKCTAQVYWTEPTASDDCTNPPMMTQTHHSGDVFDIGTHTVNYVFKDVAGNTATCTFNVTVKARSVDLQTHSRYTDGAGNTITQLNIGQQFFYEISYQNVGQENIRNTTLSVT